MAIHEKLSRIPKHDLRQVGWSKAVELTRVVHRDGEHFDSATWLHKAKSLLKESFKSEVERHLTGKETEPWEILYFKIYKSQLPIIEKALETAALMLGSDKSRGYCLEMICADFLAGASLCEQDSLLSESDRNREQRKSCGNDPCLHVTKRWPSCLRSPFVFASQDWAFFWSAWKKILVLDIWRQDRARAGRSLPRLFLTSAASAHRHSLKARARVRVGITETAKARSDSILPFPTSRSGRRTGWRTIRHYPSDSWYGRPGRRF